MSRLTKIRERFKDPPGGSIRRHDLINPAGLEFSETYFPGFGNVLPDVNNQLLEIKQKKEEQLRKHREARNETERMYHAEEYKDIKENERSLKSSASAQAQQREKHALFLAWAVGKVSEGDKKNIAREFAQRLGYDPKESENTLGNVPTDELNDPEQDNTPQANMVRPRYHNLVKGVDEEVMRIYDRHMSVIKYLTKLQFKGPQTLYQLKIYYKYFVENNVFIKLDEWQKKYKIMLGAKKYNLSEDAALARKLTTIEEFEYVIWLYAHDIMIDCAVDIDAVIRGGADPEDRDTTRQADLFVNQFNTSNVPVAFSSPAQGQTRKDLFPPPTVARQATRASLPTDPQAVSPINYTQPVYLEPLPSNSARFIEYRNQNIQTDPLGLNFVHSYPIHTMADVNADAVQNRLDDSYAQANAADTTHYVSAREDLDDDNASGPADDAESDTSFGDTFKAQNNRILEDIDISDLDDAANLTKKEQYMRNFLASAIAPLKEYIADVKKKNETQRTQMQQLQESIQNQQSDYNRTRQENDRLRLQNAETERDIADKTRRITELDRQQATMMQELTQKKDELNRNRIQYDEDMRTRQHIETQLEQLQQQVNLDAIKLREAEGAGIGLTIQLRELKENLEIRIQDAKEHVYQQYRQEVVKIRKQQSESHQIAQEALRKEYEQKNKELQDHYAASTKHIASQNAELAALKAEIHKINTEKQKSHMEFQNSDFIKQELITKQEQQINQDRQALVINQLETEQLRKQIDKEQAVVAKLQATIAQFQKSQDTSRTPASTAASTQQSTPVQSPPAQSKKPAANSRPTTPAKSRKSSTPSKKAVTPQSQMQFVDESEKYGSTNNTPYHTPEGQFQIVDETPRSMRPRDAQGYEIVPPPESIRQVIEEAKRLLPPSQQPNLSKTPIKGILRPAEPMSQGTVLGSAINEPHIDPMEARRQQEYADATDLTSKLLAQIQQRTQVLTSKLVISEETKQRNDKRAQALSAAKEIVLNMQQTYQQNQREYDQRIADADARAKTTEERLRIEYETRLQADRDALNQEYQEKRAEVEKRKLDNSMKLQKDVQKKLPAQIRDEIEQIKIEHAEELSKLRSDTKYFRDDADAKIQQKNAEIAKLKRTIAHNKVEQDKFIAEIESLKEQGKDSTDQLQPFEQSHATLKKENEELQKKIEKLENQRTMAEALVSRPNSALEVELAQLKAKFKKTEEANRVMLAQTEAQVQHNARIHDGYRQEITMRANREFEQKNLIEQYLKENKRLQDNALSHANSRQITLLELVDVRKKLEESEKEKEQHKKTYDRAVAGHRQQLHDIRIQHESEMKQQLQTLEENKNMAIQTIHDVYAQGRQSHINEIAILKEKHRNEKAEFEKHYTQQIATMTAMQRKIDELQKSQQKPQQQSVVQTPAEIAYTQQQFDDLRGRIEKHYKAEIEKEKLISERAEATRIAYEDENNVLLHLNEDLQDHVKTLQQENDQLQSQFQRQTDQLTTQNIELTRKLQLTQEKLDLTETMLTELRSQETYFQNRIHDDGNKYYQLEREHALLQHNMGINIEKLHAADNDKQVYRLQIQDLQTQLQHQMELASVMEHRLSATNISLNESQSAIQIVTSLNLERDEDTTAIQQMMEENIREFRIQNENLTDKIRSLNDQRFVDERKIRENANEIKRLQDEIVTERSDNHHLGVKLYTLQQQFDTVVEDNRELNRRIIELTTQIQTNPSPIPSRRTSIMGSPVLQSQEPINISSMSINPSRVSPPSSPDYSPPNMVRMSQSRGNASAARVLDFGNDDPQIQSKSKSKPPRAASAQSVPPAESAGLRRSSRIAQQPRLDYNQFHNVGRIAPDLGKGYAFVKPKKDDK
jgi:hypothetical protein